MNTQQPLSSKTALVLLAEGFEEMEAIVPIAILRRAAIRVTVASVSQALLVTGKGGLVVQADALLAGLPSQLFDVLLVPGGPGYKRLQADAQVLERIRAHHHGGKCVAAICAGPVVLQAAGVLGEHYTAHFSVEAQLPKLQKDQRVVEGGTLVTSRGPGTAIDFALAIVRKLVGPQVVQTIKRDIEL